MEKLNVLIIGSDLNVKGGMVSVIKNYMSYDKWEKCRITYIPCYVEKSLPKMLLFYLKALRKICNYIRKYPVDIVHLHMAERGSFYRKAIILKLCKRKKIKVILHHHGAEFEQFYQSSNRLLQAYIQRVLALADLNIVLSNSQVGMLKSISPDAKIRVLYNAVRTYDSNQYRTDAKEVLFLGRLGERKGTYDLLQAIRELDARMPEEVLFNLCGDGDIEEVLKKSEEYKISHRLGHVGWIDSGRKEEILQKTMFNVLPSYHEGLPMSILETMAYGIPNISTEIASIPEVIHHENNGFLMEPGSKDELCHYITRLVSDEALRSSMSTEAYRTIHQQFSLESHIEQLEQYYMEVACEYHNDHKKDNRKRTGLLPGFYELS